MFSLEFHQIKRAFKSWSRIPVWLKRDFSVGQQVRALRQALGMTQTQVAQRSKSTQRRMVALEKGEGDPRLSTLQKLAESLNCHLLVRMVPKEDLKKFLLKKAKRKATELVGLASASANLELQKPSQRLIREEIKAMMAAILTKKKSSLWKSKP